MKCAYHPEIEAKASCDGCGKPLCDQCLEKGSDARVLCSRCAALRAAQAASSGEEERQSTHWERKAEVARKGKKPHVAMIIVIVLAILVLLANLYMHMGAKAPEVAQYDPYKYPLLTADLINEGLLSYAKENGGRLPGNLKELLGRHVPYEKITPVVLEMFSYRRTTPTAYELRFKDSKDPRFSDIVFGREEN